MPRAAARRAAFLFMIVCVAGACLANGSGTGLAQALALVGGALGALLLALAEAPALVPVRVSSRRPRR